VTTRVTDKLNTSLEDALNELTEAAGEVGLPAPELLKTVDNNVDEILNAVDPAKHADELIKSVDRMFETELDPGGNSKKQ
jgi:hypothetical protein